MSSREQLIIDTPEQIALEFPLAGAGSRFLAIAIDTALQGAALVALGLVALVVLKVVFTFGRGTGVWVMALLILVGFVLHYGYFAIFETIWNGQTPGKRAIGIRVVTVSGRPMTPFEAILRNLLRIVDQLPGIYAIGVLSMFLSARNQRLGDLAAGTVVVREHPIERPDPVPRAHPMARYGAARLNADERALAETFLQRRHALDSYVRLQTARQVLGRLQGRLDRPLDSDVNEERVLEEIVEEYRA